jgi:putative CocE/NonD family hydrolase
VTNPSGYMTSVAFACAALLGGCAGRGAAVNSASAPAIVQDGISCTTLLVSMRDEVKLYNEIYFPASAGKKPVVIFRTPYGRQQGDGCFKGTVGPKAKERAAAGYVAIVEEARGTGNSEGTFTPFFQEQNDGYDIIAWAAAQPWSNGKVGMDGGSYVGVTQWQAAIMQPDSLLAITPRFTATDYRYGWVARNGVYDLQFGNNWGQSFVPEMLERKLKAEHVPADEIARQVAAWQKLSAANKKWASVMPIAGDWDPTAHAVAPYIWEWRSHPSYDSYWEKVDIDRQIPKVKVPAFISGGWYDLFTAGTIRGFTGMKRSAENQAARNGTMLVVDCCGHGLTTATRKDPGQINWGADKTDTDAMTARFIDHYVKAVDNGIDREPKVQLTVLVPPDSGSQGDNFIFKTSDYPAPNTEYLVLNLVSGGKANSAGGDGQLKSGGMPGGKADRFSYDPLNPVPTVGNDGTCCQVLDQSSVEKRHDVLVYTGPALAKDIAVIGPVTISFWAETSAQDTDFTAKLVDVHPDGYAHNVVDNIVRARYRNGSKSVPEPVTPNVPVHYELPIGDTATLFKKGHKVRLEISSSSFPHYARNLNTGMSNETTSETVVAKQTIFHDAKHPSFITLPVVPGVTRPE